MSNAPLTFQRPDNRPLLLLNDFLDKTLSSVIALVLLAVLLLNQTHIETNDKVKLLGSLELLLRLAFTGIAGLIGLYGFLFEPKVRAVFFSFPGAWVLGMLSFWALGTLCSPYLAYASPYLITTTAITLFSPYAFYVLGTKRFVNVVLASMGLTIAGSWFLYLVMPEYGVMIEFTSLTESVPRMGGTSHPNILAGVAALMMVIVAYLGFEGKRSWLFCLPLLVIGIITLQLTGTRVAAIAGVVSVLTVYRRFWMRPDVLPFTAALAVAAVVAAMVLFTSEGSNPITESLVGSTRSGDIEEISSFTGRAEIWEYVIKMVGERPLQGYGPGVSKLYLEKEQMLLHAHNSVLHLAFAGGVFAGAFGLMMFLQQLFVSIGGQYRLAAMLSFVTILNSLTEVPVFDYLPGTTTILWLAAIFWPMLDDGSL